MQPLYASQQKEWFSRAFLTAVSAAAGYRVSWTLDDVDGVDATVRDGGITVDFQMKATAVADVRQGHIHSNLDVATYRKLSGVRSSPGYLLVVRLPELHDDWLLQSSDHLLLRHCGYWLDLTDAPPTANTSTIRLAIPIANELSIPALVQILGSARERVLGNGR